MEDHATNMADLHKMDRTWLCSVVFTDIVNYSSQSVELQMRWKQRFNGYLADAIRDVPESERVILDTGDGAAICFLGAPEAAMFTALQLCNCFIIDEREHRPGLCVRVGINLGPVKLIRDINGALNAIGDGINAGQRVMSFAATNQILVSQSFFEVVSRLSDDYKQMFQFKGVEADKHIREHTVYRLTPPGSEKTAAASAPPPPPPASAPVASQPAASTQPAQSPPRNRSVLWLGAAAAVIAVIAAAGAWHFLGSANQAKTNPEPAPVVSDTASAPVPAISASRSGSTRAKSPAPTPERTKSAPKADSAPVAVASDSAPVPPVVTSVAPAPEPAPVRSNPPVAAAVDPARLLQMGKTQFANHDLGSARESFLKSADAGNVQAMVLMGTFYAQGLGGPKSDSDAVAMFQRSADLGNARGMYNLGLMYESGRGVPRGTTGLASAWYAKAVNLGEHDAAYRLGLMYEQGRGVTRDLNEARRLYTVAATPESNKRLASLPAQ